MSQGESGNPLSTKDEPVIFTNSNGKPCVAKSIDQPSSIVNLERQSNLLSRIIVFAHKNTVLFVVQISTRIPIYVIWLARKNSIQVGSYYLHTYFIFMKFKFFTDHFTI